MTDPAPVPFLQTRLGRFVAISLIVHVAAGMAWGVPAYLKAREEVQRLAEVEAAKQAAAAEARAATEAERLAKLDAIKERIAERLRTDHERLVGSDLPEPDRSELFKQVLAKLDKPMTDLARALADADASEGDLRNLDAELRREQVFALDQALDERGAEPTAAAFREEVATQVVPQLAEALKQDFAKRAVGAATNALDKERKAAANEDAKLRKEAAGQLADAAKKAEVASQASAAAAAAFVARDNPPAAGAAKTEADAEAKTEIGIEAKAETKAKTEAEAKTQAKAEAKARSDEGKRLHNELDRLAKDGEKLEAQLRKAASPAAQLSDAAGETATAAADQVAEARTALDGARAAAAAGKDIEAATKAVQAKQALASAAAKAAKAAKAASDATQREDEVATVVAARAEEMGKSAEAAFVEKFRSDSAPAVADQLSKTFDARLKAAGIDAKDSVGAMRSELQAMLAQRVPELAGLAEAATAALAGPEQAAAAPNAADKPATSPATSTATAAKAAQAASKVEAALVKGAADAGAMKRSASIGKGEAMAAAGQELSLRERIEYLAKGVAAGRADIASAGAVGELSALRSAAMSLSAAAAIGLPGGGTPPPHGGRPGYIYQDDGSWRKVGELTAGRDLAASQGSSWLASGAMGPASTAGGRGPVEVVPPADRAGPAEASAPQPWSPTFQTIRFASVPCVDKPPVIDGDASEWAAIPAQELHPEGGSGPEHQTLKFSWDPGGINVLATLAWPGHQLKKVGVGNFWTGDSLEVWIDCLNSKEEVRDVRAGQQFWGWPSGSADDPTLVAGEARKPRNSHYQMVGMHADELPTAGRVGPDGWTIEMRIPAGLIRNADLTPGRLLGFNAYLTPGNTGRNYYWATGKSANTWEHPNTWGDLLLAGSDGTLAIVDEQGKPVTTALAVGQPLRLVVRDRDMDLHPNARDQVLATVRTARGGSRTAVLDETGPSTGVFTGSLGTALALDEDPAGGALGVYEGERAEAVYIDQARANGARNAEIRLPFAFGSAVALTAKR